MTTGVPVRDGAIICYYNPNTGVYDPVGGTGGSLQVQLFAYQPSSLSVVPLNVDASGNLMTVGGGGGSGSNAAAGPTGSPVPSSADYTGWNSGGNLVGVSLTNALPTQPGTGATWAVTGTFWQATQPVSGTFWQATQPISAASLPLPSGAATSAKQPAIGVAGTPSADVLSVQGAAGMTALKVDGSGVTQPVSGTFWQATQPVSGTVTANQGGAWSVTVNGQPLTMKPDGTVWTLTGSSANVNVTNFPATQPVSGSVSVSNFPATQPISAASLPLPSGAATSALQTTINTTLGTPMQQTGGSVSVTNLPATQAVSAVSLPLPTGAALEAGGNLALLTNLLYITTQALAELRAMRLQQAAAYGVHVDPLIEAPLSDTMVN